MALHRCKFSHDDLLIATQLLGQRCKFFGQGRVVRLCRQFLGPVHGQVELAAAVVKLARLGRGILAVVQQLAGGGVQGLGQNLGFLVVVFDAQVFQRHGQGQKLAQRIPAQVVFLHQLLHMLGCRAPRSGFVHAAARHQRHDGQHLGTGAQLHDRKQIGEVVAQNVASHRDGVESTHHALQRVTHGAHLRHDLDVQPLGVVVLQVGLYLLDQLVFVRTVRVQPEHGGHARVAGAGHSQLDPVTHSSVFDLTHAPDIALFHILGQQHFAGGQVGDVGNAVLGDLKGLVVRAVFFSLLSHQANVGHRAHGARVEVAVPFAEVDHLLVNAGEGGLGHHGFDILQAAVSPPHLAALADHGRHGGIHNHIIGRMEVGDALGRIHHGQFGAVLVAGVQVTLDLLLLAFRQLGDLVVEVDHAVVDIDPQLLEQLAVLGERVLVEDLDTVTKHDGVRDLHHGGLDVQREHHAGFVRVVDFLFVEGQQRFLAHEHAVDDFVLEQGNLGLQHGGLAALGDELHLHVTGTVQRQGFFTMVEVAVVHVRDV